MKYITLLFAAIMISACSQGSDDAASARENQISIAGGPVAGCKSRAYPEIGGPISLINQDGHAVTD